MPDLSDLRLINRFQHGMPLCERPYAAMAEALDMSEEEVLDRLQRLTDEGILSRVGPIFEHRAAGASTLAALAAPAERIEEIAAIVNACPEVNHNYLREHHWNIWFVLTAATQAQLEKALAQIEQQTRLNTLNLPMQKSYHIDLGFPISSTAEVS